MKVYLISFAMFCSLLTWVSCKNSGEEKEAEKTETKEKNPNAISEMAALMRKIDQQAERLKGEIAEGKEEISVTDFSAIRTAETTKENIHSPGFSAFAESYLEKQEQLVATPQAERKMVFNEMIDICMSCHSSFCPGPTMRIKRYYFPKEM